MIVNERNIKERAESGGGYKETNKSGKKYYS